MYDASHMPGVPTEQYWRAPTLQRYPVYFVRECGFTFEFHSIEQLEVCLAFFCQKVRPSSMIRFSESDRRMQWLHFACQRWFERLPMQLLEERRRVRIVPALKKALTQFKKEVGHAVHPAEPRRRRTYISVSDRAPQVRHE
jgi:hypothetical protein